MFKKRKQRRLKKMFKILEKPLLHFEVKVETSPKMTELDTLTILVYDRKHDDYQQAIVNIPTVEHYNLADLSRYIETQLEFAIVHAYRKVVRRRGD